MTKSKVILGLVVAFIVLGAFAWTTYADCYRGQILTKIFWVNVAFATPKIPCEPGGGGSSTSPTDPAPITWALTNHWGNTFEENNYFSYTKGQGSWPYELFTMEWDWENDGFFELISSQADPFDQGIHLLTGHSYNGGNYTATFKSTDSDGNAGTDSANTLIYPSCAFGSGQACQNTVWDGFRWTNYWANNILYTIDVGSFPSSTTFTQAEAVTAIENALARWDAASNGVRFTPNPLFTVDGVPGRCNFCGGRAPRVVEINNTIYWAYDPEEFGDDYRLSIGSGYRSFPQLFHPVTGERMGMTTCSYNSTREEFYDAPQSNPNFPTNPYLAITDCDTVLSPNLSLWSVANTSTSGKWDLESYMMHAIGNWLGLGDLTSTQSLGLVMNLSTGYQEIERNLGTGDITGIQALYGN